MASTRRLTARTHCASYNYPFLHPGLVRAVICGIGERAGDAGVYWCDGAWIYDRDSASRVLLQQTRAADNSGSITVGIQGSRPESVAKWLSERIDDRNRLFGCEHVEAVLDEALSRSRDIAVRDRGLPHKARAAAESLASAPQPPSPPRFKPLLPVHSARKRPSRTSDHPARNEFRR